MPEEIIHSDNVVSVSTSRVVIRGTTYALRNITSVKMTMAPAKTGCAIVLIVLAIVFLITALAGGKETILGGIFLAAICGVGGYLWLQGAKADYHVTIASSSGEVKALTSKDKPYIEKIVSAINEAIIRYR